MPRLRRRLDGAANTLPYEASDRRGHDAREAAERRRLASGDGADARPQRRKERAPPPHGAAAIAEALPNAQHRILAGQEGHNPSMAVLASALRELFGASRRRETVATAERM
jgi:hypothetical protein